MAHIKLNPSWPLWAIGGSSLALGISIGGFVMLGYHLSAMNDVARQIDILQSKNSIMEVALNQSAPFENSLDKPTHVAQATLTTPQPVTLQPQHVQPVQAQTQLPAQPATPQPQVAPKPPAAAPAQPAKPAPPPPQTPQKPVQPAQPAKPAPAAAAPQPALSIVPITTPQPPKPAVTGEELVNALKNKKIEAVTPKKANIDSITQDRVTFASGTVIRVGEKFPSGEKLIMVDPSTNKIVTDQRQILLIE